MMSKRHHRHGVIAQSIGQSAKSKHQTTTTVINSDGFCARSASKRRSLPLLLQACDLDNSLCKDLSSSLKAWSSSSTFTCRLEHPDKQLIPMGLEFSCRYSLGLHWYESSPTVSVSCACLNLASCGSCQAYKSLLPIISVGQLDWLFYCSAFVRTSTLDACRQSRMIHLFVARRGFVKLLPLVWLCFHGAWKLACGNLASEWCVSRAMRKRRANHRVRWEARVLGNGPYAIHGGQRCDKHHLRNPEPQDFPESGHVKRRYCPHHSVTVWDRRRSGPVNVGASGGTASSESSISMWARFWQGQCWRHQNGRCGSAVKWLGPIIRPATSHRFLAGSEALQMCKLWFRNTTEIIFCLLATVIKVCETAMACACHPAARKWRQMCTERGQACPV